MTVRQLIAHLHSFPQGHEVVIDRHSEFVVANRIQLITGFDNGGYVSKEYREEDKLKVHGYVYIGLGE